MLTHYLLSHLVAVATALATTLMVLRLLSTNRTPQSLMAWALAMVFVPVAAIPLYFLIGARKFPRKAKRSMLPPAAPTDLPPPGPVARVLARLGAPPARDGHHLKVLAEVRFVLADRRGTSAYYRINEACVDCFPTAADLVMGKPAPRPAAAAHQ